MAPLTAGYYACIARWEERYPLGQFGVAFETWASRVPAIIPAFHEYVPADRPFALKNVLRAEFHGLALILVAPVIIEVVEYFHQTGTLKLDRFWTIIAIIGIAQFVVFRFLKKRTPRS